MYWNMVLEEVLGKQSPTRPALTNIADYKKIASKECTNNLKPKQKKILKIYPLGEKFKNIYFTKREAECMLGLLKGKIIDRVALDLGLSPRTVEFYLKNMRSKLCCRTKSELIRRVQNSDFMKNVDFT